ncbi:ADP-ribosylation factor-like protein 15 [Gigantopelta aegis]|uniref:ADP-ribosylation factor-like protein 15 n=1 Tax=Gigantopelta aegis TaxID=1735272 RepID=UPI001B889EC3|nr:ADP-ribosylation factor-like protein 15 [Gigantopelta aegis]
MCENVQLICALCRVGAYSLYRRICCKGPPPVRPNICVLCLGLSGVGKSSLLAMLSGDDFHKVEPTIGFSIKAILFDECILEVKELGGSDTVRQFWDRYYQGMQGIIFVINSTGTDEELEYAKTELRKALDHPSIRGLPLLVLANFQNQPGAKTADEISKFMDLESETNKRQWTIQGCSLDDKEGTQSGFLRFNEFLLDNMEKRAAENGAGEINRV